MGKTESGALWLSAEQDQPLPLLPVLDQPGRRRRGPCLRFFTDLGQEEIEPLLAEHQADPGRRAAQRRLAAELTRLVHGDEGLAAAQRATEIFFGAEIGQLYRRPTGRHLRRRAQQASCRASGLPATGLPIIDALVESGLAKNKGEARRIIAQGGAYVNNRRVEGIEAQLGAGRPGQRVDRSCCGRARRTTPCCGLCRLGRPWAVRPAAGWPR